MTANGAPVLLLQCRPDAKSRAPIRLKNLSVEFRLRCKVVERKGRAITAEFARVACTPDDEAVHKAFIAAAEAMLRALPIEPTEADITNCIDSLVEIFTALARPSRRSIKGLWAELFLISIAKSADFLLKHWHLDADEKYDFSFGKTHLEVKASEMLPRVHEFAVEQIRPPSSADVYIASVLVQRSAGGIGILDLLQAIRYRTKNPTLMAKAWANVAATVGRDFTEAVDVKFDPPYTRSSLRIVKAQFVPCVQLPMPVEIVSARLRISMDECLRKHGQQWQAVERVLPRDSA